MDRPIFSFYENRTLRHAVTTLRSTYCRQAWEAGHGSRCRRGYPLTLEQLVAVARDHAPVDLAPNALEGMRASLAWVDDAVAGRLNPDPAAPPEAIYSINTGFGSLAGREAFQRPEQASDLSRLLIISNVSGVGRYLDEDVVRAAMLIRVSSLARGLSGIRPEVVLTLVEMLNRRVLPAVPEYGSLGASGDLIPLAHLAIVATRSGEGEDRKQESGEAFLDGRVVSGLKAMRAAGIERIVLGAKEGLALLNGTSFSTAMAALAVHDADRLVRTSEVTAAMTIEALTGFGDAFLPRHAGTPVRSPARRTSGPCCAAASSSAEARTRTRSASRRRMRTRCAACRRSSARSGTPCSSRAAWSSERSTPRPTIL